MISVCEAGRLYEASVGRGRECKSFSIKTMNILWRWIQEKIKIEFLLLENVFVSHLPADKAGDEEIC